MVLRVTDAADTASTPAILGALEYAVAMKARGVNVVALNASLAEGVYDPAEAAAIQAAGAAGMVFCCAAGNSNMNNDAVPSYPGNYRLPNMLVAAATDQHDNLASFSNYGPTTVDLAAPGVSIFSSKRIWESASTGLVTPTLKRGTVSYQARELVFAGSTSGVTGMLIDCGKGLGAADFPPEVSGGIALIERGGPPGSTAELKLTNAMRAGARGAVIYNTGDPASPMSLGSTNAWIPGLVISRSDGLALLAALPATVTITALPATADNGYSYQSGSSLATPLVSAAVALAAAHFPWETAAQRAARVRAAVTPLAALSGKVISGGRLDLARVIDADGDQLPDWWELRYFGGVGADPAADADGDGFTNLQEYRIGTVPTDPFSLLTITRAEVVANGAARDFRVVFPTAREVVYQVEQSDGLVAWEPLGAPVAGTGEPHAAIDPNAAQLHPRRFYRVRILTP
jgi:subtilisin family serine protease